MLAVLRCDRDGKQAKWSKASLLVVPPLLVGSWRAEAKRLSPSLKLTFQHQAETDRQTFRHNNEASKRPLCETDLAVTTYQMLLQGERLMKLYWRLGILDEFQAIKNPTTRQSNAAKKLPAQPWIPLTGTAAQKPIERSLVTVRFSRPRPIGVGVCVQVVHQRLSGSERKQRGAIVMLEMRSYA